MIILAADTSSQALSVALKTDSFFEERTSAGRSVQHSERLVPTITELCKDAGITTKDIEVLACTRGPGSFTGLRIGMSALKGMAYALDKPLVSVSTMEVLANAVPCFDGAVVTVMDAKKQRWYLAAFEKKSEDADAVLVPQDIPVPNVKVEEKFFADNVAPTRSYEVRNANMVLRVNSRHSDIIGTRIIDGKKCLVIEMTDDLTVNGIPVEM